MKALPLCLFKRFRADENLILMNLLSQHFVDGKNKKEPRIKGVMVYELCCTCSRSVGVTGSDIW